MKRRRRQALRPSVERLDDRTLLSGLTPAQVTSAYGLNALTFAANGTQVRGDGSGQTIAIIEAFHDPNLLSDLAVFDAAYRLPAPTGQILNLAGSTTDSGWAGEETLDVEWAHAVAPGARIVLVEARSDTIDDLMAAVQTARAVPGVSVVSMSWGGSEYQGQTGYDSVFTTPAGHTGITYVAASGDGGSRGGAEWPSSSPNVLAVGGTTLQVGASGNYLGESVWSGTSGGNSRVEPEPAYQRGVQSSGARSTPDVSFDGDPNTGVAVYTTDPATGRGAWSQVAGTSLGAPAWAAIVAIADQGRALSGRSTLDGASQTLPAIYGLPSADFHAVAGGTTVVSTGFGRFRRTATVSTVAAGRGTPNGAALVNGLVNYGSTTAARSFVAVASAATATTARTATQIAPVSTPVLSRSVAQAVAPTGPVVLSGGIARPRHVFDRALSGLSKWSFLGE